jgi:hypothetical protein
LQLAMEGGRGVLKLRKGFRKFIVTPGKGGGAVLGLRAC